MTDAQWPPQLARARVLLSNWRPYISDILWAMTPVPGMKAPTIGVDPKLRLAYNKEYIEGLTTEQLAGRLYEESLHWIRRHGPRMERLRQVEESWGRKFDPKLAELCFNLEIADDINQEGIPLPEDPAVPSDYGLSDFQAAEYYYKELKDVLPQMPPCDNGDGDGGSNDGEKSSCECGAGSGQSDGQTFESLAQEQGIDDPAPGAAEAARQDAAEKIQQHAKGIGNVPGHLVQWAEMAHYGTVRWEEIIRLLSQSIMQEQKGMEDYTFLRRSRRQIDPKGVILPAMIERVATAHVYVDMSGSMDKPQQERAIMQVKTISQIVGELDMFSIDTQVRNHQRVTRSTDKLHLTGGGGTHMMAAVQHAASLKDKPRLIIILTDGMTSWSRDPICNIPVIVGVVGETGGDIKQWVDNVPSWAKVVPIVEPLMGSEVG